MTVYVFNKTDLENVAFTFSRDAPGEPVLVSVDRLGRAARGPLHPPAPALGTWLPLSHSPPDPPELDLPPGNWPFASDVCWTNGNV